MEAIVLFAHGSRAPELRAEMSATCKLVRERSGGALVEMGFLELAEPDLYYAVKSCVDRGAVKVTVIPYLLNVGTHLRRDLPALIAKVRADFPRVRILLAPHLGIDPLLADLVLKRAGEAVEGDDPL